MSPLSWSPLCPIHFLWLGSGTGRSKDFPWLLGSRVPSSSSISSFLCLLGDLFLFLLPHYSPPLHLRIQLQATQLPAHSFLGLHPYSCLPQLPKASCHPVVCPQLCTDISFGGPVIFWITFLFNETLSPAWKSCCLFRELNSDIPHKLLYSPENWSGQDHTVSTYLW